MTSTLLNRRTLQVPVTSTPQEKGYQAGQYAALSARVLANSAHAAANSELIACDTTAGTFAVTLPAASAGKCRVVVKWVAGTVAPTIALTGSDHFNSASGPTTPLTPLVLNQGYVLESDGSGIWTVTSDDLPLSQLDARYPQLPGSTIADYAVLARLTAGTNHISWTTKEELVARALGWFIVTDPRYGAVGDSATDNTTAITAAITAASAAFGAGATVYFPPAAGDYLFSNLSVPAGVSLVGCGWSLIAQAAFGSSQYNVGAGNAPKGCVLRSTATSGTAISFTSTTTQNRSRELLVVGPGSGTSTGIAFSSAASSTKHKLDDIMVVNFQTCWDMGIVEDSTFTHLSARGCATGFKLGSACNQNVFTNTEVQFSSSNGIYNNGGAANRFYGILLQNNSGNADIYHVSGESNLYEGVYRETSGTITSMIQLDAGSFNRFRDWWVSSPIGAITLNGGGANVLDGFDGGNFSVTANGGTGVLKNLKGLTLTGSAATSYGLVNDSSGGVPGTRLGPGEDFRVQSGRYVYLETTGTNSYIRRNGGTGDSEYGSGTTLHKFLAASANLGLIRAGMVLPQQAKSGSYTLLDSTDHVVQYTAGAATLSDPTTVLVGRVFEVKNATASSTMNVSSAGTSMTIDGAATVVLQPWQSIRVYSDGTQWLTLTGHSIAGPVLNLGGNLASLSQDVELRLDAPSTRNATLKWRYNGADKWQMYTGAVSASMFLRDLVNGVMALSITPGAGTSGVATFPGVVQAVAHRPVSATPTFNAAQTVDQGAAAVHYITMTGNITSFSVSNPRPDCEIEVHFIQDATGSRTLAGATGIKWAGGAPTLTTTAGKRDIFRFRSDAVGTMWEIGRSMNVG